MPTGPCYDPYPNYIPWKPTTWPTIQQTTEAERITDLEARIAQLEARIAQLEAKK